MTKSATREAADKVTFTQTEVNSAVALKAPIASPSFTGNVGVGTASPASELHVEHAGGSGLTLKTSGGGNFARFTRMASGDTTNGDWSLEHSSKALVFKTNAASGSYASPSWINAMNINSAGIVTKPYQPAFDAYSHQNAYSTGTSIASTNISSTRFNTGNHYSTSGLRFVAPVAGVYRFNYRTILNGSTSNAHIRMFKNGSIISGSDSHYTASTGGGWGGWTYSILVQLSVNDYVQVGHTSNESIHGMNYQSFNGYLIG